jgi:hypothetical protein
MARRSARLATKLAAKPSGFYKDPTDEELARTEEEENDDPTNYSISLDFAKRFAEPMIDVECGRDLMKYGTHLLYFVLIFNWEEKEWFFKVGVTENIRERMVDGLNSEYSARGVIFPIFLSKFLDDGRKIETSVKRTLKLCLVDFKTGSTKQRTPKEAFKISRQAYDVALEKFRWGDLSIDERTPELKKEVWSSDMYTYDKIMRMTKRILCSFEDIAYIGSEFVGVVDVEEAGVEEAGVEESDDEESDVEEFDDEDSDVEEFDDEESPPAKKAALKKAALKKRGRRSLR